ncbi:MAG: hypothetical protein AAGD14_08070 [Planctomycetota bacterium]
MRTISLFSLVLAFWAGPALAQGALGRPVGKAGQALRDALTRNLNAGPGAIQKDFFGNLEEQLVKQLGSKKGAKYFANLQKQTISTNDVQKLMNGQATRSQMADWFSASRPSLSKLEQAVDDTVAQKNRDGFFGILIIVMVQDFGMDPTADFCAQVGGAKEELDEKMLKKLVTGNVSTSTIEKAFGLESKQDCKFMQEILNAVQSSPFVQHPMMTSLGMGGGKFVKSAFPTLEPGMPGAGMDEEKGAGGMPCDFDLPPCPFMPESFSETMKSCKVEAEKAEAQRRKQESDRESK